MKRIIPGKTSKNSSGTSAWERLKRKSLLIVNGDAVKTAGTFDKIRQKLRRRLTKVHKKYDKKVSKIKEKMLKE